MRMIKVDQVDHGDFVRFLQDAYQRMTSGFTPATEARRDAIYHTALQSHLNAVASHTEGFSIDGFAVTESVFLEFMEAVKEAVRDAGAASLAREAVERVKMDFLTALIGNEE